MHPNLHIYPGKENDHDIHTTGKPNQMFVWTHSHVTAAVSNMDGVARELSALKPLHSVPAKISSNS
jgi:hypothetical protein